MKILYIHQYAFDHSQPGFTKPLEILSILKKERIENQLISGMYSHITRKKLNKYKNNLLFCKEEYEGVKIIRVSGFFNLNSFLNKFLNHFIFMVLSFIAGLATGKVSIVYASSPSPFAAISGYLLSLFKRVPFILEVRDIWPEDLIQEGLLKKGILSSLMENCMKFLYKKADLIITVTQGIKRGILKRNICERKIKVIPNSVNLNLFNNNIEKNRFRQKIGIKDEFVILYAGNHQISNALDKIIDACNLLRNYNDIKFVFVGSGEDKEMLIKKSKDLNLDNVIFIDPQPKYLMPEVYAMADLSIVSLKNIPAYNGALPNKFLDSMASAKPILLAAGEEAKEIIEIAKCGLWAKPEDPEEISKIIKYFYENREKGIKMGINGKNFVTLNFSNEKMAAELYKTLKNVVDKRTN